MSENKKELTPDEKKEQNELDAKMVDVLDPDVMAGAGVSKSKNSAKFTTLENGYKITEFKINGKVWFLEWLDPVIGFKLLELVRVEVERILYEKKLDLINIIEDNTGGGLINNFIAFLSLNPEVTQQIVGTLNKRLFKIDDKNNKLLYSENENEFYEDPFEVYELLILFVKLHFISILQKKNYLSSLKKDIKELKPQSTSTV